MPKPVRLSPHARQILSTLSLSRQPLPATGLEQLTGISRRSVYYALAGIDSVLEKAGFPAVQQSKEGYYLLPEQQAWGKKQTENRLGFENAETRLPYILCCAMYPEQPVTLLDLIDLFGVSRNTVLSDLARARQVLEGYGLTLENNKKDGYYVSGETFRRRAVLLYYLGLLFKEVDGGMLPMFRAPLLEHLHASLLKVLQGLEVEMRENQSLALAGLIYTMTGDDAQYTLSVGDLETLYATPEYKQVELHFPQLTVHQKLYLAIHLLGFRQNRDFLTQMHFLSEKDDLGLLTLSRELTDTFEQLACVRFGDKERLVQSVYLHLKLTLYTYSYSVQAVNPFLDEVKKNYSDLYDIAKRCCESCLKDFPFPLFESEISFLAMHFGAQLNRDTVKTAPLRILVVCPTGKTTSMLLRSELETNFPQLQILDVVPTKKVPAYVDKVDLVISTVPLDCPLPVILVSPLLTRENKNNIASWLTLSRYEYQINENQYDALLAAVEKHVDFETYDAIRAEFATIMRGNVSFMAFIKESQPGLPKMLSRCGLFFDRRENVAWRDAVVETSARLLRLQYIAPGYVQRMIDLVEEYGPYIAINPRIAIAHAQPEGEVHRMGLACTIYPAGLAIAECSVQFLFVLATPDQNEHLHLLRSIVRLYEAPEMMDELVAAQSPRAAQKRLEEFFTQAAPN